MKLLLNLTKSAWLLALLGVSCTSDDEARSSPDAPGGCAACAGTGGAAGKSTGGTGGSPGGSGGTGTGGSAGSSGSSGASGSSGSDDASGDAASDAASDAADGGRECNACDAFGTPASQGTLKAATITELSGIAASQRNAGVFYANNDSGDSARFFAFDASGAELGEFVLEGATAADWEDMAVGPCPSGSCVFIGDIGDNSEQRASVRVYRVSEPVVSIASPVGTVVVTYDAFELSYETGPRNAETLLVHPATGDLYVVSKSGSGTSLVFKLAAPTSPGAPQVMSKIADLVLPSSGGPLATGGSIHPACDRFLLRTYGQLYEYVATGTFESAFTSTGRPLSVASEGQGEAVTYLADGRGYVTVSEGQSPPLNLASCQ
jgi:hypothetical protein